MISGCQRVCWLQHHPALYKGSLDGFVIGIDQFIDNKERLEFAKSVNRNYQRKKMVRPGWRDQALVVCKLLPMLRGESLRTTNLLDNFFDGSRTGFDKSVIRFCRTIPDVCMKIWEDATHVLRDDD